MLSRRTVLWASDRDTPYTAHSSQPESPHNTSRLRGTPLVAMRTFVIAAIALALVVYVLALPGIVPYLSIPCEDALGSCAITPQQVAPLAQLGVTPHALAVAITVLSYLAIALVCTVAGVLLWRRSDDWMALLVALTLVLMPAVFMPITPGLPDSVEWLDRLFVTANSISFYLLVGLFPSGRFVPRWLWIPVLLEAIFDAIPLANYAPNVLIAVIPLLFTYACLLAGQIYRYRNVSTPAQRQQTKWVVVGIVLILVIIPGFWLPVLWVPALQEPDALYALLLWPVSFLAIAILAISFGVAILRYRLYEIDVIIRRTLIYGSLTAILAAVYVVGVIGVQALVNTIAHKPDEVSSPILIVITTLLIAALFQPLRQRIQRFIDRRFYRSRYDTRKTLDSFSTALRQEVDLPRLTGRLVEVVHETMQPEHVSLWLREQERV